MIDQGFSKADRGLIDFDQCFSMLDKPLSMNDQGLKAPDKGWKMTDQGFPEADKGLKTINQGLWKTDKPWFKPDFGSKTPEMFHFDTGWLKTEQNKALLPGKIGRFALVATGRRCWW
jgi:hypothetical protein